MPTILKVFVYFLVLVVLVFGENAIPKTEKELRGMMALLVGAWLLGGILIIIRTIFRFITR
jgi:hypothetical protein